MEYFLCKPFLYIVIKLDNQQKQKDKYNYKIYDTIIKNHPLFPKPIILQVG